MHEEMGDAGYDPGEATRRPGRAETESTQRQVRVPPSTLPPPPPARPVLGLVAVYSELAVESEMLGMLGRTYPLREGDVLFVGKPPHPEELILDDGRRLAITHVHLFPFSGEFEYVSRRHLAIEMRPGGEVLLMDFSTNGVFLVSRQEHVRRRKEETVARHSFRGPETLVLGVDLRVQKDRKARERAAQHQLQVMPLGAPPVSDQMETRP